MTKKVRVNATYYFNPCLFDKINGNSTAIFKRGDRVRVVNLYSCPPANTMGMCYIVPVDAKKDDRGRWDKDFAMVMTNSLQTEQPTTLVKAEQQHESN
jgi:hypothetical protein